MHKAAVIPSSRCLLNQIVIQNPVVLNQVTGLTFTYNGKPESSSIRRFLKHKLPFFKFHNDNLEVKQVFGYPKEKQDWYHSETRNYTPVEHAELTLNIGESSRTVATGKFSSDDIFKAILKVDKEGKDADLVEFETVVIKKQAEKVAVSEEEVDIDEESEEAIEDTQEQTAPSTN